MTSALTPDPAQLLPHGEPMVLISSIADWDDTKITCLADSHRDKNNPLRQDGVLSIYAGIEYAAQAMAIHAHLTAPAALTAAPRKGYLAAAAKLSAAQQNLDHFAQRLTITVEKIAANDNSSLYHFAIAAATQPLLSGQLTAVME